MKKFIISFAVALIAFPAAVSGQAQESPSQSLESIEWNKIAQELDGFDIQTFFETHQAPEQQTPQPSSDVEQETPETAQETPADESNNYSASDQDSSSADEADTDSSFEQEVIRLTNKEREKHGLEPLQADSELSVVAEDKSKDMRDAGYFSHNSPNHGSPFDMMDAYGIDYRGAGENIAAGQTTPEQVVQGWMDSQGHRENILNGDFTHIGVGHVEGGSYGHYWTQMFITK
ncbi:uncharacterized protein, YkwD family [Alteribacillus persepolensis]|uniref:Uncharacterized protein, YkwD family n=1 Tax=Alteribacillus persepolensis TaxID=568899 RepID=A0A1G8FHN0_9BACI|nr:CAP domain-containing protein [Alteribacillus persepolensis]SDH81592.1 uncharacterized protein, YkwD family [Alteribacillus persepolensis]